MGKARYFLSGEEEAEKCNYWGTRMYGGEIKGGIA